MGNDRITGGYCLVMFGMGSNTELTRQSVVVWEWLKCY